MVKIEIWLETVGEVWGKCRKTWRILERAFRFTKNSNQLPRWQNHRTPIKTRWTRRRKNSWQIPPRFVERFQHPHKVVEEFIQGVDLHPKWPDRIPRKLRLEEPVVVVGGWGRHLEKALQEPKSSSDEAYHETERTWKNWEKIKEVFAYSIIVIIYIYQ